MSNSPGDSQRPPPRKTVMIQYVGFHSSVVWRVFNRFSLENLILHLCLAIDKWKKLHILEMGRNMSRPWSDQADLFSSFRARLINSHNVWVLKVGWTRTGHDSHYHFRARLLTDWILYLYLYCICNTRVGWLTMQERIWSMSKVWPRTVLSDLVWSGGHSSAPNPASFGPRNDFNNALCAIYRSNRAHISVNTIFLG